MCKSSSPLFAYSATTETLTLTAAAKTSPLVLGRSSLEHGCGRGRSFIGGTPGPGVSPAPGAHPVNPGTGVHFGRMPAGLSMLLCHVAVSGARWYHQHPCPGPSRERECDRDVSMIPSSALHLHEDIICTHMSLLLIVFQP